MLINVLVLTNKIKTCNRLFKKIVALNIIIIIIGFNKIIESLTLWIPCNRIVLVYLYLNIVKLMKVIEINLLQNFKVCLSLNNNNSQWVHKIIILILSMHSLLLQHLKYILMISLIQPLLMRVLNLLNFSKKFCENENFKCDRKNTLRMKTANNHISCHM